MCRSVVRRALAQGRRPLPGEEKEGAFMAPKKLLTALAAVAALAVPGGASADVVTDWNRTLVDALYTARTAPQPGTRIGAIVQTSVFDAVNGIKRRYTQFHPELL